MDFFPLFVAFAWVIQAVVITAKPLTAHKPISQVIDRGGGSEKNYRLDDDVSRGFRTVFEPSVLILISPTRRDTLADGENDTTGLEKRRGGTIIPVNRDCIQDVNFRRRPWDFKQNDLLAGTHVKI